MEPGTRTSFNNPSIWDDIRQQGVQEEIEDNREMFFLMGRTTANVATDRVTIVPGTYTCIPRSDPALGRKGRSPPLNTSGESMLIALSSVFIASIVAYGTGNSTQEERESAISPVLVLKPSRRCYWNVHLDID